MEEKKKKYFAFLYLLFLLLCYSISMLTNNWLKTDGKHIGLWVECNDATGCTTMVDSPSYDVPFLDWFSAVRSFMVLPCLFVFLSIVFVVCNICYDQYFRLKPAQVALIFCAIFLIFAIVVFAVEKRHIYDSSWKLDWSFYITCVSFVFTILGVVILYIIKDDPPVKRRKPKSQSYEMKLPPLVNNGNTTTSYTHQLPPSSYSTNQNVPFVSYSSAQSTNQTAPINGYSVNQNISGYSSNQNPQSFGVNVMNGKISNQNDSQQLIQSGSRKGSKADESSDYSETSSESGSEVQFV